ncbi:NADPH:quinone reductase [Allopusillimonas soli]|uniref:NADPH:quinone reductase n=1 Tax=Allopusillimonas soli TaxID=659016 RepID=A0A853FB30_9BURK|nr:NADPH:quinone reductase [Allopusillimonas soli]NYT37955.1 NADPH:quinone reductase [Allopusillimonas soli]TEA73852.1 NADPH:quinone reductase [Allopusillimonas soli]
MRAAWYSKNGPASEVLQVGELPDIAPAEGEVRVRLAVSGVNPSDVKSRGGSRPVTVPHLVPHSDGAGVVESVGPGVDPARVGERVWIWNGQWRRALGTAAEYITLPAGQAMPLPQGISFEAGACLGIPALTGLHAVQMLGALQGKTVLVIGASSSVGFYAAQIAHLRGARVIGTVGSAEKAGQVKKAGIADLIDYKREPVAERIAELTGGRGVDAIIDMDLSTTTALVTDGALAPHGSVICYGSNQRTGVAIDYWVWLLRSLSLRFFLVYDLLPDERQADLNALQALLREDRLLHHIGPAFALKDIAQAHEAVESGKTMGKVLVTL